MQVDLLKLVAQRLVSPGFDQIAEEGAIRDQWFVYVQGQEHVIEFRVQHLVGQPHHQVLGQGVCLAGVDVRDLGAQIAQGRPESDGRTELPQQSQIRGKAVAHALAHLDARPGVRQVAADELQPDAGRHIVPDIRAVRGGDGRVVTAESAQVFPPLTGAELFAQVQQRDVEPDVSPSLHRLGIAQELVGHVVGQAREPLAVGEVEFLLGLSGQGGRIEVAGRGVVGDGHIGLAHGNPPGPWFNQQKQDRGLAFRSGGDLPGTGAQPDSPHQKRAEFFHKKSSSDWTDEM